MTNYSIETPNYRTLTTVADTPEAAARYAHATAKRRGTYVVTDTKADRTHWFRVNTGPG